MIKPLKAQLAEAGYAPASITTSRSVAYHWDHTANANDFAAVTWLVRQVERDAIVPQSLTPLSSPRGYAALRSEQDDHDQDRRATCSGTGPSSRAGSRPHAGPSGPHLKLAKSGPVVLSGDLYHYPEERKLGRCPPFGSSIRANQRDEAAIDAFLKRRARAVVDSARLRSQCDSRRPRVLRLREGHCDDENRMESASLVAVVRGARC